MPGIVSLKRGPQSAIISACSGYPALSSAEVSAKGRPSVVLEMPFLGRDVAQERIERPIVLDQALVQKAPGFQS